MHYHTQIPLPVICHSEENAPPLGSGRCVVRPLQPRLLSHRERSAHRCLQGAVHPLLSRPSDRPKPIYPRDTGAAILHIWQYTGAPLQKAVRGSFTCAQVIRTEFVYALRPIKIFISIATLNSHRYYVIRLKALALLVTAMSPRPCMRIVCLSALLSLYMPKQDHPEP